MKHQAMILIAVGLKRGANAGCALTVQHNGADGSEFVAWCITNGGKLIQHTLEAAHTTQERLNAHWIGFVENCEAVTVAV